MPSSHTTWGENEDGDFVVCDARPYAPSIAWGLVLDVYIAQEVQKQQAKARISPAPSQPNRSQARLQRFTPSLGCW